MALIGTALSALVAAVVTYVVDIWTASDPLPGVSGVHAEAEIWWDLSQDQRAVRPAEAPPLEELDTYAPDVEAALDQMVTEGGVNAGNLRIRLTVLNFSRTPVEITEVRARVAEVPPVPDGPLFICGGPQGGVEISRVRLDLGEANPVAQEYDDDTVIGRYPTRQIQLARQDEPAIFDVQVLAGEANYTFVIDVSVRQGTNESTITVDHGGRPFALAPGGEETAEDVYRCGLHDNTWFAAS